MRYPSLPRRSRSLGVALILASLAWPVVAKPSGTERVARSRAGLAAVMLVFAAGPQALADGPGAPPNPFTALNPLNLNADDPSSAFVASRVTLALARANASGAFPPLAELQALLNETGAGSASLLLSLPDRVDYRAYGPYLASALDTMEGFASVALEPVLSTFNLFDPMAPLDPHLPTVSGPWSTPSTEAASPKVAAAQAQLAIAELGVTNNVLESIGYQLQADAGLFVNQSAIAGALNFAGLELESLGYSAGALGSGITIDETLKTLPALTGAAQGEPGPASAAPAPAVQEAMPPPDPPSRVIMPEVIYGEWRSVTSAVPSQFVIYRITRSSLTKVVETLDSSGQASYQTERHPGSVDGQVAYRRNPASPLPAPSLGPVNVTILVTDAKGGRLMLHFTYCKGTDWTFTEHNDFLTSLDEPKLIFIKTQS